MKIEMLAAKNGDCLILHYGTPDAPGLILIDGGPAGVWDASLQPRLMQLREERGLAEDAPLVIDLLIISHVDDDHINGVLRLLQSMLARRQGGDPPLFRIKRIWHNSFDNILGNDETVETLRTSGGQLGLASTEMDKDALLRAVEPGPPRDAAFVLASVEQGDNVRRLAHALGIPLNPDFGGKLIQAGAQGPPPVDEKDLELIVVGPLHDEVVALQSAHDEWLKKHPERQKDADALLAALDDKAVANLSSIIILVRSGGKTLLLTGDARADKALDGLETRGVIGKGEPLDLDILKMPHHGSIRNINDVTIRRLPARHYLFSGNGKFLNPDRETFELLFAVRPGAEMDLVLSYSLSEIDKGRQAEYQKGSKSGASDWDEAKNGLAPILNPAPAGIEVTQSQGISVTIAP